MRTTTPAKMLKVAFQLPGLVTSASSSSGCRTRLMTDSLVYKLLIASVSRVGLDTCVKTALPALQLAPLRTNERPRVAVTTGQQEHGHSVAVPSNHSMSGVVGHVGMHNDSIGLLPGGLETDDFVEKQGNCESHQVEVGSSAFVLKNTVLLGN